MTATVVTNGQSIGTSTNIGQDLYIVKTAVQASSSMYSVTVQVTNGTGNYPKGMFVKVWYASCPTSLTASLAAAIEPLRSEAHYVMVYLRESAGQIAIKSSPVEWLKGGFIFTWAEIPKMDVAASLTITTNEQAA